MPASVTRLRAKRGRVPLPGQLKANGLAGPAGAFPIPSPIGAAIDASARGITEALAASPGRNFPAGGFALERRAVWTLWAGSAAPGCPQVHRAAPAAAGGTGGASGAEVLLTNLLTLLVS